MPSSHTRPREARRNSSQAAAQHISINPHGAPNVSQQLRRADRARSPRNLPQSFSKWMQSVKIC